MMSVNVDPADPLALHKLIFLNQPDTLNQLLAPYAHHIQHLSKSHSDNVADHPTDKSRSAAAAPPSLHPAINSLDNHFHTPLHLAVMLNRKDMVPVLLQAGANPITRSGAGWTPRQEAASMGNREMIEIITRYQRKEFSGSFKTKAMNLVKQLSSDLDQFYFQLQWEFQSWVPFVSGLCPKDTYHIWKKGNCVRMDTSLVGFENMKWLRGHISIIFRVEAESGPELVVIDRVKKITQRLARSSDDGDKRDQEPTDEEITEEVSSCFNSNITSTNVPTSAIKFQRAKQGLWGYRSNKVEKVGEFECAVWKMDGVEFRTRVRTEHLKDEFGKPIVPPKRRRPVTEHKHPRGNSVVDDGAVKHHGGRGAQPRRSTHQPLFATFAEPKEMKDTDSDTTAFENDEQKKQISFSASSTTTEEKSPEEVARRLPKKHKRSTGTISDDAFFETALEEAEGSSEEEEEDDDEYEQPHTPFRESLPPPPATTVMFEEYFDSSKQGDLHLGRPLEQKESRKAFGATLWMYDNNAPASSGSASIHANNSQASITGSSVASSQDGSSSKGATAAPQFPLTVEKILPLLEVIGMDNNRLVGKLREFLEFKLPPGFPIRANIPVYPSLSADVTFVNYDADRVIGDDMFEVPGKDEGYVEGHVIRSGGEDDA
ncbi:GPCR-chaperone-domain-containing protein [Dissophora ornata]|nr:GPCR-chaperone-domain-containing protein [Dissophora ornata]